jgi:hypothetical protein
MPKLTGFLLACCLSLGAQAPPAAEPAPAPVQEAAPAPASPTPSVRLKQAEVKGQVFQVEGARLTVVQFHPGVAAGAVVAAGAALAVFPPLAVFPLGYPARAITLRIENTSDQFLDYLPKDFVIVCQDGSQAVLEREFGKGEERKPQGGPLAPHAFTEHSYRLSQSVRFPATIYYQRTALAEVTE